MYRDLTIRAFRGFQQFSMTGLGRINLLVGVNNSGKTTVLEALSLLPQAPDPQVLHWISQRRDAMQQQDIPRRKQTISKNIAHLFYGHSADIGSEFSLAGTKDGMQEQFIARILANPPEAWTALKRPWPDVNWRKGFRWLQLLSGSDTLAEDGLVLSPQGGLLLDDHQRLSFKLMAAPNGPPLPQDCFFESTFRSRADVISALGKIMLNPEQAQVVSALHIIEPQIEGIALGSSREEDFGIPVQEEGIFIKLQGQRRRLPISTMGDGIWRILGLVLAAVECQDGLLLVDDIDNGLHYSVLVKMWNVLMEMARRLNVQVFATTHSRDCVEALAQIVHPEGRESGEISLQRIEQDRAVAYSESAIIAAAERGIEVR